MICVGTEPKTQYGISTDKKVKARKITFIPTLSSQVV
jgi:hypothetical protein